MLPLKRKLLSTTFLPLMVSMGVALAAGSSSHLSAQSQNPCAAKKPVAGKAACNPCAVSAVPCNPCAAKGAASDRTYTIREGDSLAKVAALTYGDASLYRMLADYNGIADPDLIVVGQVISIPANPCAAQKVAAAANPCNPCNPCAAANPCNPCNPCAAQGTAGASDCVVPRLQTAAAQNPCAAANPCNPCNPCAAANPCNPCAANPCAAAAANPCNPCNPCAPAEAVELTPEEASAAYECIKGAMQAAYTGQLQGASANPCNPCAAANPCNPCNPCAATQAVNPCNPCAGNPCAAAANPCSPCNPCAVIKPANPCAANPCNPCAAKKPLNPCAANPCNPCAAKNPCKPGAANTPCNPALIQAAVTGEAATVAQEYQGWERLNTMPYVSATHGSRYVNNYPGPEAAAAYGKFEDIGTMPAGGRIAKDSFTVTPDGRIGVGPLFLMEKMAAGFNAASDDWRYTMIMPDGSLFGVTNGQGSQNVQFCAECHAIVAEDQDSLYFMPEEFRLTSR
jgi:LysM repeat protein